jgi:ADP-heptose:LPS heptosyltransferase
VVFRALQLGDMLNAVPAFRALRVACPRAQITLVGLPWARDLVERLHPLLDAFIPFPGYPGLPEQPPDMAAMPGFVRRMQEHNFDLALQMHGSGEISNHLMTFWGAKRYAGFYPSSQYFADREGFLEYPAKEPERWRHLRLMEFLGVPLQGDELEFPIRAQDWRELEELRRAAGLGSNYVCIHPGARKAERRWPAERFAAVADGFAVEGYQVVLTGSRDEAPLVEAVAGQMRASAVNLAGKTSLGGLAALISGARLLVSNDTGVSHVAAAIKAPSLILFSVPDYDRWAPANRFLHKIIVDAQNVPAAKVLRQGRTHLEALQAEKHGDPVFATQAASVPRT